MTLTRKSAYTVAPGKIEIIENTLGEISEGQVLLKVFSCAVCGSDVRILAHGNPRVKYPQIMGHEIAGEIVQVGKGVDNFKIGDRVALGADVPCGECEHCKSGRGNCCDINYAIGYQFEGGFSEYMLLDPLVVKEGPLHKIPDNVDYNTATLAEPLACCINGYERGLMNNREKASVVIFGAGPVGILLSLLAPAYKTSQVIMIDPNEERLNRAKNEFKVTHIINPLKEDAVKKVFELTGNKGADMIFTACTAVDTHEMAIDMLAKRGVVNLFGGLPKDSRKISFYSNDLHYKEAYITGSHGSTPDQHKKALNLIAEKKINVEGIITHTYPLSEINEAFEMASSGKAIKIIIHPNEKEIN